MPSLVAPVAQNENSTFEPAPAGLHIARCVSMIQIGTVDEEFQGKAKKLPKVRLTWELCYETKEYKEGEGEKPILVSKTYTHSMFSKATLRAHVDSWRGKSLTDAEADEFDLLKLLGAPCQLNVVHETSQKGNTYAAIKSIVPLGKGTTAPDQVTPSTVLLYSEFNWEVFNSLPEFVRKDMEPTPEFRALKQPKTAPAAKAPAQAPQPRRVQPTVVAAEDDNDLPF